MSATTHPAGHTPEELAAVRVQLVEELARLEQRAGRIDDRLHNRNRELPKDWDELAQLQDNEEVVEGLEPRTLKQIRQIRAAIQRLDRGDWAHCSSCGWTIEAKRLAILPSTTLCARCAH